MPCRHSWHEFLADAVAEGGSTASVGCARVRSAPQGQQPCQAGDGLAVALHAEACVRESMSCLVSIVGRLEGAGRQSWHMSIVRGGRLPALGRIRHSRPGA